MFGYVNVNKKDLSKEEAAVYRAYYCGLCQTLSRHNGHKGQALLNYDMTFLIILLTGLYEPDTWEDRVRCGLHPAMKQKIRVNRFTDYAADMTILLSWQKFADDYRDEHKRYKKSLMRVYREEYRRVARKYPRQTKAVEASIRKLHQAERSEERNLDVAAASTGELLGEIFVYDENDIWAKDLREMGFYLGKFIYLMDAYEDVEKDHKNGNYNVLIQMRHENSAQFDEMSRALLISMMSESARSFERLPILLHAQLLRNVIYSGVWTRFEAIQAQNRKKEEKKRKKLREGQRIIGKKRGAR